MFYLQSFSVFQSTPPVKAATFGDNIILCRFYISIHAAREGGDVILLLLSIVQVYFNPRRP